MTGLVIRDNGTKQWYQNDLLHHDDGPAVIHPHGSKYWYQHGELHRVGGPAVMHVDGTKRWYLFGYCITKKEHAYYFKNLEEFILLKEGQF